MKKEGKGRWIALVESDSFAVRRTFQLGWWGVLQPKAPIIVLISPPGITFGGRKYGLSINIWWTPIGSSWACQSARLSAAGYLWATFSCLPRFGLSRVHRIMPFRIINFGNFIQHLILQENKATYNHKSYLVIKNNGYGYHNGGGYHT